MKSTFNSWYDQKMYATPELAAETERVEGILERVKTIAVVGISKNPQKDSYFVARYLKNAGYGVIPVNPTATELLDQPCYPDLASIPEKVDAVDIFRRPEDIPATVREAIALRPIVIWCQLGTGDHPELKAEVEAHGIAFIQERCMKVDHQFLIRPKSDASNA
jgi:predicted CoA-binding protein